MDDTDTIGLIVLLIALGAVFAAARWRRPRRPARNLTSPNVPAMTLGTPEVRLSAAGRHVPVDRRQRMGIYAGYRWVLCDQIPTLVENQIRPYSGHSCAHRCPHGSGKLFVEGRQSPNPGVCYE